MADFEATHVNILIVGTGFSGIGAAITLQNHGFYDFLLLERAQEVGGVWRDNHYPGAACDVESHLYSFSFAKNPRWSREFAPQPEILDYAKQCVSTHQLRPHMRFGCEVHEARWSEREARWHLSTSLGHFTANYLISAVGGLSEPAYPELPGLSSFRGHQFHSSRWEHDVDLRGRKVAVIGTGASAVQFVPAIQPKVAKLTLFQRTPAWVLPRFDRAISPLEQQLFARFPALQQLARARIYLRRELLVLGFRNPQLMRVLELAARLYLQRTIRDPALRAKLTPSFRLGCKRILITSEYLPALDRENVEVVGAGIREVRERSVIDSEGREHMVDVLIFGTGFKVADLPFAHHVRGRAGKTLHEVWDGSLDALRATFVSGFPNLFFLLGPGSGLGHTSVLLMLESQLQLMAEALEYARDRHVAILDAKADAQARFMAELQGRMEGTVWLEGGCASWYLDKHGRPSTLWPGSTLSFKRAAHFHAHEFDFVGPALPIRELRAAE